MKVGGSKFLEESQDGENEVLGCLDAFRAVKLALQHLCKKASLHL